MRKIIVVIIGLVVIGCKSKQVANQINHESEINLVVDNWHQAAAEANFNSYFNAMTDDAIFLKPAFILNIERGLEQMGEDEYLEITPKNVRLRKKFLTELDRVRAERDKK
jgi:predicted membrane GTPase involved in stress response